MKTLKPKYSKTDYAFETVSSLFDTFTVTYNHKYFDRKNKEYSVKRSECLSWANLKTEALYFKTGNARRLTDVFLADANSDNSFTAFTTIAIKSDDMLKTEYKNLVESGNAKPENETTWLTDKIAKRDAMEALLKASELFKSYDDVEVPDDYINTLMSKEGDNVNADGGEIVISDAERRKLEQKVVYNTFVDRYTPYWKSEGETYQRSKREETFEDIKNYKGKLYYGFKDDVSKLQFACHILDKSSYLKWRNDDLKFCNADYKIITISKSNEKHFKDHLHIDEFFGKPVAIKENDKTIGYEIIMDNAIVKWNTARKLSESTKELQFMKNFANLDTDVAEDYAVLKEFMDNHTAKLDMYRGRYGMNEHYDGLLKFLDDLGELDNMVKNNASNEEIASFVKESSLPKGSMKGIATNVEIVDLSERLLNYASPIKALMNHIPLLKDHQDIPMDLLLELQDYIRWKGVKYEKSEKCDENKDDVSVENTVEETSSVTN